MSASAPALVRHNLTENQTRGTHFRFKKSSANPDFLLATISSLPDLWHFLSSTKRQDESGKSAKKLHDVFEGRFDKHSRKSSAGRKSDPLC